MISLYLALMVELVVVLVSVPYFDFLLDLCFERPPVVFQD